MPRTSAVRVASLAAALLVPGNVWAQEKPTLTAAEYARFETLGSFELDPTGRWLVASVRRVDGSVELRLRRADRSGETLALEHARSPEFSRDGRWMAYRKGVSPDEAEEAERPVRDRLGLVDLSGPTDTVLFEVASFSFRDDGRWLAAYGYAPADTVGADLVVMDPGSDARTLIGNVDEYAWQDEGALLAATLRTAWGTTNGVIVHDPDGGTLRTLDTRDARYRSLTWREESGQLGVLRSVDSDAWEEESHDVLVWRDATRVGPPVVLSASGRPDLPDSMRVSEHGGIEFGAGGRTIFVGLQPRRPEDTPEEDDAPEGADGGEEDSARPADNGAEDEVEPADVQVWHWDDDQILRGQEYFATQNARRTLLAAWHLDDDRLVRLADDPEEPVRLLEGGRWGVVPDYTPYRVPRRWGDGAADWYRVDTRDGARTLLAEGARFGIDTGPDPKRALVYHDERWTAIDLETMARTVLAEGRSFTRSLADYDYPGPRPDWGVGGWTDDGAVLLYDKHDVWRADLGTGHAERLTRGGEESIEHRVVRPDPTVGFSDPLPAGATLWLSIRHLETQQTGYARIDPDGTARRVLLEDALVGGLTRARSAERYALRRERWDDAPDVFVAGSTLDDLAQVTEINPFQDEFAWGRSELLSYTTDAGHDLSAVLVYPAGFVPGRRYPLILYQYERLSNQLHRYDVPSERDYYNYQAWSQQGYFVLMPDIVYEPGRPGPSALDAVEHALDAALATGHVDPERMGLIGHSWGGYQASYLPTRTDRFAASVAGAAITNFLSFMGAVHWNGGLPESGHWETGQARMAVPYWDDLEGHLESSPANYIADLRTPMLLMHGDADGVVDFRQGLEFYNYARRAGKEVVLLVYPGADHGLSKEPQQVDYHRRILEWFGHYLKGEAPARWITEGESWEERARRLGEGRGR